jgi:SAM-dependent methyltransferase
VPESDYLARPDPHLDPLVAAEYDDPDDEMFGSEAISAAVAVLSDLAGGGTAVEFAVGTGRLAIPLAETGVQVYGVDFSEPMLAELRKKEGASSVSVTVGDMTSTQVCGGANLVYLAYNTIMNLRTQSQQVACFRNAAAHLGSGGRFLIENLVPQLHRLPPGETIAPFDISTNHLGFDEYVDRANQISISHHYDIDGDRVRICSPAFRYVWPSELDLMAELAGMTLESRWSDWHGSPFTSDSISHVSVWRKP